MQRRHDLDWVRVCAFGLLVLYHVGMYYVSWDWHVKSPYAGTAAEPLMFLTSPWRLSLLFLVSGAATAWLLSSSRRGWLGRRSWRLLLPLVFGMLVVVPPQSYYEVVEKGGFDQGWAAFYRLYLQGKLCRGEDCLATPTWNHLWFVAYLWVYTLLLAGLRAAAPSALQQAGRRLGRALSGPGLLLWPALLLAVLRMALVGRFESTHALVDDWYNHAQYFSVFLLGYLLAREEALWQALAAQRHRALGLWLGSWMFLAWYFSLSPYSDEMPPPDALRGVQRVVWGLNQWCAIAAVLGYARHWNPGDSPALRYLVPAVFPVYILHQTLIVVLSQQLKPLGLAPALEAPLLVALTLAGCFAGYEGVRRLGWLRPLFGLPVRRRDAGTPASAKMDADAALPERSGP